jgi:hypothetical protein
MDKLILPVSLINAILQYLGQRPYAEVFTLINAIEKEASEQIAKPNE